VSCGQHGAQKNRWNQSRGAKRHDSAKSEDRPSLKIDDKVSKSTTSKIDIAGHEAIDLKVSSKGFTTLRLISNQV
jgi:hypothetical protein